MYHYFICICLFSYPTLRGWNFPKERDSYQEEGILLTKKAYRDVLDWVKERVESNNNLRSKSNNSSIPFNNNNIIDTTRPPLLPPSLRLPPPTHPIEEMVDATLSLLFSLKHDVFRGGVGEEVEGVIAWLEFVSESFPHGEIRFFFKKWGETKTQKKKRKMT